MGTSAIGGVGMILQAGGAVESSIGAYQSGVTNRTNYQLQGLSDQLNQQLSAMNAVRSGINAKSLLLDAEASDLNSWVSQQNAAMSERGAEFELQKGNFEQGKLSLQAGQLKSTQRASMAANGVDLSEGNAAEVQASTDLMKDIDMSTIASNAVRSAFGYRQQAVNDNIQSLNAEMQAANYRTAAGNQTMEGISDVMKANVYGIDASVNNSAADSVSPTSMAMTSLMSGAGNVATSWYRYKDGVGNYTW
jgi:hypothetical protein